MLTYEEFCKSDVARETMPTFISAVAPDFKPEEVVVLQEVERFTKSIVEQQLEKNHWIIENCNHRVYWFNAKVIFFEDKNDAMRFKLTW